MKKQQADKSYFIEMVRKHAGIIHKICNLYAAGEDREDLKQEIIYQLWKSFPVFRGESSFQTWMYRVSINTAMVGLRVGRVKYTSLSESEAEIADEEGGSIEAESRVLELYRHIARLNDMDKTIVFLYLEKCTYEEIAEIIGISKSNVSVRLVRIKDKLKQLFTIKHAEG
jgi:RNA polymerase sigma-70 factor (ECF subfamily)